MTTEYHSDFHYKNNLKIFLSPGIVKNKKERFKSLTYVKALRRVSSYRQKSCPSVVLMWKYTVYAPYVVFVHTKTYTLNTKIAH